MATVFTYRKGYRAQARDASGHKVTKDFALGQHAEAKHWAAGIEGKESGEHPPELGGPTQTTLAVALAHYAALYTVTKRGAVQELNRIGHYLAAAKLPLLRLGVNEAGKSALLEYKPEDIDARVSEGWQAYLSTRRANSARTYAFIAKLACMRVSAIRRTHIDELFATMVLDGLSPSTIQKEIALLKSLFNTTISQWHWSHFKNPCTGVKLGVSEHRFVKVTQAQYARLYAALEECDNPWFWPLVDTAIFLTARRKSLLKLRWSDIDLEGRCAHLYKTKTKTVIVPLSRRVVELLSKLPHHPSGYVFPMTANAVKCAWDGVRKKANLPALQFRDLRHLGGTYYARLVRNAHVLKQILGHQTIYMAEVYINMTEEDLVADLDFAEDARKLFQPPLPTTGLQVVSSGTSRKAQRVIEAIRRKYAHTRSASPDATAKAANNGQSNVLPLFAEAPSASPEKDPAGVPKAAANGGRK